MKELSLHILDIAQNSVSAGAQNILIRLSWDKAAGTLDVEIDDDGCGMDSGFLKTVTDPFTTTRTTRKVGMGLPFFKMAAEQTGGQFDIRSTPGEGTRVRARFMTGHIDVPPVGDLAATMVTLIQGAPKIRFICRLENGPDVFELNTEQICDLLEGVPIDNPEILLWIDDYVRDNQQDFI